MTRHLYSAKCDGGTKSMSYFVIWTITYRRWSQKTEDTSNLELFCAKTRTKVLCSKPDTLLSVQKTKEFWLNLFRSFSYLHESGHSVKLACDICSVCELTKLLTQATTKKITSINCRIAQLFQVLTYSSTNCRGRHQME